MARIRTIKPGFFTDYEIGELSKGARLLFIGLWTSADKEGRLKDRPKQIKVELLPYDDDDVDELLNEIGKAGFILRYTVEDNDFIQIINFAKHQRPHPKEPASLIPAPVTGAKSREKKRQAVEKHGEAGTGREKDSTSRVDYGSMDNGVMDNGDGGHARDDSRASVSSVDDEFLSTLQANPAYAAFDVKRVYGKMVAWCEANRKMPTRRRLVNWLNREDAPMNPTATNGGPRKMVV